MNSFSIAGYENQPILDTYKKWLVQDLYQNYHFDSIDDPNFMQKLSYLQAEGIRHDIAMHAVVTSGGIQRANLEIGKKLQSAASMITSSLDDGFSMMNNRMVEVNNNLQSIDRGVGAINQTLKEGTQVLASSINKLDRHIVAGLSALRTQIAQSASIIQYQMQQSGVVLKQILDELRIPESQRERRYHIEEGMKFFNKAMQSGDCLYFDDALDEFNKAVAIERKDFFSWYYIGMIYLYSADHLEPEKALSAFDRYIHYADALSEKHELYDEAWFMKAECKYLSKELDDAYGFIERMIPNNTKAALRGMKYLSASPELQKRQKAVEILQNLMQENPFIVMQILEDYDLVNNDCIINFLGDYKEKTALEIVRLINDYDDKMDKLRDNYPINYYSKTLDELNELKRQENYLKRNYTIISAIELKEQLIAFASKEKETEINCRKLERKAYFLSHGYVDLGLPSGTLWKNTNEEGGSRGSFFYFKEALEKFGKKLPSKEQMEELANCCTWEYQYSSRRYVVTGPNGKVMLLPALGHVDDCPNGYGWGGESAAYWTSDIYKGGNEYAFSLSCFKDRSRHVSASGTNGYRYAVRLVDNE